MNKTITFSNRQTGYSTIDTNYYLAQLENGDIKIEVRGEVKGDLKLSQRSIEKLIKSLNFLLDNWHE